MFVCPLGEQNSAPPEYFAMSWVNNPEVHYFALHERQTNVVKLVLFALPLCLDQV